MTDEEVDAWVKWSERPAALRPLGPPDLGLGDLMEAYVEAYVAVFVHQQRDPAQRLKKLKKVLNAFLSCKGQP